TRLLRVQRGEVLCEAFAEPLFVIVLPADGLPPPLMRELVGEKELGESVERRRIVAPRRTVRRDRVLDQREVPRAVSAGQFALDERNGRRLIRDVADDRCVEAHDVFRLLRNVATAEALT